MDRATVEAELLEFAVRYAASKDFQFYRGGSYELMTGLIANGADHINEADQLAFAKTQLAKFVDVMIEHWEDEPSLQVRGRIIGEMTFAWARNKLCPMPPFC